MSQLEELKIFLASPSDVGKERQYVEMVIDELNQTVAADKGVYLRCVSSENAFPGYGKDGQAILNEQIGNMQEYDLFIGIVWSRLGTPTPRAKSGTAEEFGRAVQALRRRKKPQVWFYFRQSAVRLPTTLENVRQLAEVIAFKNKFRGKGLFRDYKNPADFRDQLRKHLTLWLSNRYKEADKSRTAVKKLSKPSPKTKVKAQPVAIARDRNPTPSSAATTKRTSTTLRKTATLKRSASSSVKPVKSPSNWVMLNEKFFQTESSVTQPDQSIVLRVAAQDLEQSTELKALYSGEAYSRKQIAYADQHHAGLMQVSSLEFESIASKTRFEIKLAPGQRSQNSSFGMEFPYNGPTANEIAQLRVRLLLLNEVLPKEMGRLFPTQITDPYGHRMTIENSIFPELWVKLQSRSQSFLPKAWLWAVYHLKQSQLVEDILALELGPIKNKVMPVRFRGRRRQSYNQEPFTIEVAGNCPLSI